MITIINDGYLSKKKKHISIYIYILMLTIIIKKRGERIIKALGVTHE